MIIAITHDDYTAQGKPDLYDSASSRWKEYLERKGHIVKFVDVRNPDALKEIRECDGFMWRWAHFAGMGRIARRLLPVVQNELKIPVYPDIDTCWHYDDKVSQSFLFQALDIPTPQTWTFFSREQAANWVKEQKFPLVVKLPGGAGSNNVALIRNESEAMKYIGYSFHHYLKDLKFEIRLRPSERWRFFADQVLRGKKYLEHDDGYDHCAGQISFQEYLDGNQFDTRITVIGNRAFGYRRFNREGDFRASGSGIIDYEASKIDTEFVKLAFSAAKKLRMQSCAVDGLYRHEEQVLCEVSYTYVSGYVWECPGRWSLTEAGDLRWTDGQMWPEEAQVEDFLTKF